MASLGQFFQSLAVKPLLGPQLDQRLNGKQIIVIGGTAGLGRGLAISALRHGAKVTIVGRRQPDEDLKSAKFIQCDLSSMKSASQLVEKLDLPHADVLMFTNGIITTPERQETSEGLEKDLAVSFLSRMAIMQDLSKMGTARSNKSEKPRVFIMGAPGNSLKVDLDDLNSNKYYPITAHMNTVACNEGLVDHIKEKNPNVNVYGLNPGIIETEIRDNYLGKGSWMSWFVESFARLVFPSAQSYADNVLVQLVASPELEDKNGALFGPKGSIIPGNPWLKDNRMALMTKSQELLDKALRA